MDRKVYWCYRGARQLVEVAAILVRETKSGAFLQEEACKGDPDMVCFYLRMGMYRE